MVNDLPTGIVTLLFTDIEGSTKLLHELGAEAFTRHDGIEIDTQGDAFFYAFPDAREAIAAAAEVGMDRHATETGKFLASPGSSG